MDLLKVYEKLLKEYGKQNWWPMIRGFRPKEWEVCVGAILTQNTNWRNVERALENLLKNRILSPEDTLSTETKKLEEIIRPSGFYKQKAERLKKFARFVLDFGSFENFRKNVEREELLEVKGIGFETCDSILLYACERPYFVIDAYTKRFVRNLGIRTKGNYESLRNYFEKNLPRDVGIYKEFHALIVEWGKQKFNLIKNL
ncbi:MAG: endonuclease [Candidatus Aenigmarchaeota archaeon]|nr:endonuclease [Candidatus Aenigmarchaeota archaeon]